MLSRSEISAMRATIAKTLPETARIERMTRTPDGMGGSIETWTTIATVSCRIAPAGYAPSETAIANRISDRVAWTMTFPAETDIDAADRVVIGDRVFEVIGVFSPRTYELSTRVIATEV